jgi:putative ABC transport system ATP-binding protein
MIELTDICKTFTLGDQQVHALRDVDLSIGAGEYVSVMGPSGSGKSTLLNLIALLDRPTSGSYRLDGEDVTELDDDQLALTRREKIGFVFQFFHLIPRLSAAQNIEVPLVLAGTGPAERRERLQRTLADYGLAERAEHRPDQLSGGQRQRVAIARATIMGPALLLADEPTGNLDTVSGNEIVSLLEALNDQGMSLIVVTHDPDLGQRARRRVRIVDGRIARDESAHARA